MHTPSVFPKRTFLAERARSMVETRSGAFDLDGAREPYVPSRVITWTVPYKQLF